MTEPRKTKRDLTPAVAVGFTLFVMGLLAWVWLGDWRWAVTGLGLLLASAVLSAITSKGPR